MPQDFVRRDVQLVLDQTASALRMVDNLRQLTNHPVSGRILSIVYTELDTAVLRLQDLANKTPESL